MRENDPYPAADFDDWAATYDADVVSYPVFPFAGYAEILDTVVEQTAPEPGMTVLDIGTGTGNLGALFAARGCDVWGSDFSEAMLTQARLKLPETHFVLHDLRDPWPGELDRRFDRVVSAYVFHHFDLADKVRLCRKLIGTRLVRGGRLVIADLSFPDRASMDDFGQSVDDWEPEEYWLADEALASLAAAGLKTHYLQVSPCAAVYSMHR